MIDSGQTDSSHIVGIPTHSYLEGPITVLGCMDVEILTL